MCVCVCVCVYVCVCLHFRVWCRRTLSCEAWLCSAQASNGTHDHPKSTIKLLLAFLITTENAITCEGTQWFYKLSIVFFLIVFVLSDLTASQNGRDGRQCLHRGLFIEVARREYVFDGRSRYRRRGATSEQQSQVSDYEHSVFARVSRPK